MKRLLCLLCGFLCFSSAHAAQNTPLQEVELSVVQIVIMSPAEGGAISMGSGFFTGDGNTIASAAHVYWQAGAAANERRLPGVYAQKASPGGKKFIIPITPTRLDDSHDLVLFSFDPNLIKAQWPEFVIKPLKLSEKETFTGDDVMVFGYIGSHLFTVGVRGPVAGDFKTPIPPQFSVDEMLLGIGVNPGCSGGPVVSFSSGEVVGVVAGFLPSTPLGTIQGQAPFAVGVSRAVRGKFLRALLQSNPTK